MVDTRSSGGKGRRDGESRQPPSDGGPVDDPDAVDWVAVIEGLIHDGSISVRMEDRHVPGLDLDLELEFESETETETETEYEDPGDDRDEAEAEEEEAEAEAAGRGPRAAKRKRKGGAPPPPEDNPAMSTYDTEHHRFYGGLPREKRARIAELEREIHSASGKGAGHVPTRFRLLESRAPPAVKAAVMARVESLFRNDSHPGERSKLTKWLDAFLRLPLGVCRPMPVTHESPREDIRRFVLDTRAHLDANIHGHADAKEQIIRTIAKWISNPNSRGTIIGIQGPPGCGKTTLVRNCIAQALGLPMVMIPLGGVTDGSVLSGHLYTYEGSTYGAVASSLMHAKCMNPVILLDELDKVGGSDRGQEVVNTLIHMTDPVQNEHFVDNYFADVPLDLSRALMVLTFNSLEAINPILRDRMAIIKTSGYDLDAKRQIAQRHLLPRIAAQHGMPAGITITDRAVSEIVRRVDTESGVRNLERAIDTVVGNINLSRMMSSEDLPPEDIDVPTVAKYVPHQSQESFSAQHIYL
eukprot:jgi/Tetstr1/454019/TSEL_040938.t1